MNRTKWTVAIAAISMVGISAFGIRATVAQQKASPVAPKKKVVPISSVKRTGEITRSPLPPEMKAAIEADFARARVKTNEARLLFEQGKMREAEAICQESFNLAPRFNNIPYAPDQKQLMGEIAYAEGDYKKALHWFGDRAKNTWDGRESFDIALCYIRMGDYANAKRHYSHDLVYRYSSSTVASDLPIIRDLKSLEAAILLAQALEYDVSSGEKKASDGYDAAARLDPTNMWLHAKRGWIAHRAGRWEEGYALMRKAALSKNPHIVGDASRWLGEKEVAELRKASGIVDKPTAPAN